LLKKGEEKMSKLETRINRMNEINTQVKLLKSEHDKLRDNVLENLNHKNLMEYTTAQNIKALIVPRKISEVIPEKAYKKLKKTDFLSCCIINKKALSFYMSQQDMVKISKTLTDTKQLRISEVIA